MQPFPVIRASLGLNTQSLYSLCARRAFSVSVSLVARNKPRSTSRLAEPQPISPNSSISLPRARADNMARKSVELTQESLLFGQLPSEETRPSKTSPAIVAGEQASSGEDVSIKGDSREITESRTFFQPPIHKHPVYGKEPPSLGPRKRIDSEEAWSLRQPIQYAQNVDSRETVPQFDPQKLVRRHFSLEKAHPFIRKTTGPGKEAGPILVETFQRELEDRMSVNSRRIAKPVLFICDMQEKFRSAIWEFENVYVLPAKGKSSALSRFQWKGG